MSSTTQELVNEVIETGKRIAKRETQRFPEAASFGDSVRQGDVYITLIESVPKKSVRQKKWDLQLAPGNTQGSRHILDSEDGVECYVLAEVSEFDGPILLLQKQREVTHPEHGNWILPPGTYAISYQRTQDALNRQRRVRD